MDCTQNIDNQKLVREGTSQEQRRALALDPGYAPVNERTPGHLMVFARAYATYLQYYDQTNTANGDWQRFFADDISVLLATAAIQDIKVYAVRVQEIFAFLNNLDNDTDDPGLRDHLGHLFCIAGSLAQQIDLLKTALPNETGLKSTLSNLIQTQLASGFRRLIAYYDSGIGTFLNDIVPTPDMRVLGAPVTTFSNVLSTGLSSDWITDGSASWTIYRTAITPQPSIFGTGVTVFDKVNHIATHNLFTAIFDQLLKVYTRTIAEAKLALEATLTNWDQHEPHYTLFLAFLRLNEYARQATNTLTARHLDFYYRDILQLKEKPAAPGQAHLLLELAKHVDTHLLEENALLKAGKDDLGKAAFFANNRDLVANKAKVVELKTLYRHINKPGDSLPTMGHRLFASPITNSDDGLGGAFVTDDQSWHPFFNKIYTDGNLSAIKMSRATVGFAIGSHYLYMAEGARTITLDITIDNALIGFNNELLPYITCSFTTKDGWLEKVPVSFTRTSATNLRIIAKLEGNDPAITPYIAKTHGFHFEATLPVLMIGIRQDTPAYIYLLFQNTKITNIALTVNVIGLKTLAVNNDFGPVDTSKPFLPFGPSPIAGSSLIFGSKEVFQKNCTSATIKGSWQVQPNAYGTLPDTTISFLKNGIWGNEEPETPFTGTTFNMTLNGINNAVLDTPNFTENEPFATNAAYGFARIAVISDFGQTAYQNALRDYLIYAANGGTDTSKSPNDIPQVPIALSFSLDYTATQQIAVSSSNENTFKARKARFYHIAPFGDAEKHAYLNPLAGYQVHLFPQFDFERDGTTKESIAEFYVGISDIVPPQNVALLFQVSDGTADPLSKKPDPSKHIHWSYLRGNEWASFAKDQVEDLTGELTRSGIVTLVFPREATSNNTILPSGQFWIRLAVSEKSEAVCRLLLVGAQALLSTFSDKGNDPAFPAKTIPAGTITKLNQPDAGVKKVTQPFDSFNGRGAEAPIDFYRRISERLRHKDRAITLWDYEKIILEAFPMIYRAKCLNHTEYEPTTSGLGTYRELAPGHVTIVTIPNQEQQNVRNPLRPYTSLGTLLEIETFLKKRLSCFVRLHVKNPQFEEVKTEFKVRFYPGFDETFYLKKLKEELTRFLSPWAFPGGGSPSFGGKIYKSVLINFIEERPWVDYVADFKLRHKPGNSSVFSKDLNEAIASTAVSILVSVPASQHLITLITLAEATAAAEQCPCES